MLLKSVNRLLTNWQKNSDAESDKLKCECYISQHDDIRIQAFAKTFNHSQEAILEDIIHTALDELERSIPYIPGSKVIRMEDGDPIYEDIGLMPHYLRNKQHINPVNKSSTQP